MKFEKNELNLGDVKLGVKVKGSFKYTGEADIISMFSGCGCTTPVLDEENKEIKVEFKKNNIPKHLEVQGVKEYNTTIPITINEKIEGGHNTIILTLKAKLIR